MLQQQTTIITIDEQTIAQAELNAYIEQQAQEIAPEIEIDSDVDSTSRTVYRVFYSYHLLGTFYQNIDASWVVQSSYCNNHIQCNTETEAQLLIVAISRLLATDTATESVDIDQLMDKPFDELTLFEWERLKQHAIRAEFTAA